MLPEMMVSAGSRCELDEEPPAPRQECRSQMQLQQALERAAFEWRSTFDAIQSPILLLGLDGRLRRLNRAAKELAGRDYRDLIGRPVGEIGSGQPWEAVVALATVLMETFSSEVCEARDEKRSKIWEVEGSVSAGYGDEGQDEARIIVQIRDVTETVRLQESLRHSETMAALGAVVAGVAHEVRNPLFGMSAVLDAFESRFGDRQEFRPYLPLLRTELGRMTDLMQALLDYGKPARLELALHPIEAAVEPALALCWQLADRSRVLLRVEITSPDEPVLLDRGRLVQAIKNLVENAIQHSPAGAEVVLCVQPVRIEGKPWVRLTVRDHGPGFAASDILKVFEPFFSRRKGGTGLGLSIVSRIVEGHGGRIRVGNHAAGGALVELELPCARPQEVI